MKLRYRCPQCKRWIAPHWTDRTDAFGIAVASMEPVAYIIAIVMAAAGFLLEWWSLIGLMLICSSVLAWVVYQISLRKARRFYCPPCDKVFRGDYLRGKANAPQITEIAP